MARLSSSSLHVRLAIIILLVMAPALALMLYTGLKQRQQSENLVQDNALRMTNVITIYQEELILRTHQIMTELARVPSVRTYNTASCSAVFTELRKQYPTYTDFMAATPDGEIFCSSSPDFPFPEPINVSERDWFKRSIQIRDFAVSDVVKSISGHTTFTFGFPLFDENGNLVAVIGAGLGLNVLNNFVTRANLPEGSTVTLIDGHGTILARYPETNGWEAQTLPDAPLVQTVLTQLGDGTAELPGIDGVHRLYAFTYMRYSEQGLHLAVGIPTSVAYNDIDRMLTRNLASLGLITLFELLVAIVGGSLFILRPIRGMVDATHKLSSGDLSARMDTSRGVGELRPLALAFNEMAVTLEQHEADLRHAEARYRTLVEKIPTVIYTTEPGSSHLNYISPRIETLLGYSSDELLSQPGLLATCIHADDQQRVQQATTHSLQSGEPLRLEYRMVARDGREVWVRDDAFPVQRENGENGENGGQNVLQGTLMDITERKQASEIIQEQQHALRELSTPLLNIGNLVMLMPLIGTLDSQRAAQMMDMVLRGIQQHRAKTIILDITGVPIVDTQVANALIQTERSVRLLGARVILTGIRPEVAQALVGLGVDLSKIVTYSTLEIGIQEIIKRKRLSS